MSMNTYVRKDGVVGVGFEIDHADRPQVSIAWKDRPAERFSPDELERKEIRIADDTESKSESIEFERPDGVHGAGFEINYAGRRQFSVAWPDGPATRFTQGEMGRQKIHIVEGKRPAETNSNGKPAETVTKKTVDDLYEPNGDEDSQSGTEPVSEAESIRQYIAEHPEATNKDVVAALAERGIEVSASQVSREKRKA